MWKLTQKIITLYIVSNYYLQIIKIKIRYPKFSNNIIYRRTQKHLVKCQILIMIYCKDYDSDNKLNTHRNFHNQTLFRPVGE